MRDKVAMVTGATGGVGGEVARALLRHGWRVRALTRNAARARREGPQGVEWVEGDAMSRADMTGAATGASLLFHGANPPGYRNWRGMAMPMLANAIAAALQCGARLVYPGSLYPYGPDAWPLLREDSPQHPRTRKGAVRAEMEEMLAQAARQGLRTLLVRAGDFFGPHAPSSWVTKIMLRDGQKLRAVVTPERPGVGHAWAYLPDLAETVARLADMQDRLAANERVHFTGHYLPGPAMAQAVRRASGGASLPIRSFRWLPVLLGAPFVTLLRELLELRYLWREPIRLDNARLLALLGEEPHTELDAAIAATSAALRERAATA